jgi:tungstate transport system substrate-binding protein
MRLVLALLLAAVPGCGRSTPPVATITLATTTSTRDSGLLDQLLPPFQEQTGIEVRVVAVGSGQALELGRRGDADVLLTHAPAAEEEFVAQWYALRRVPVMYNDFVLLGPPTDSAGVRQQRSIGAALRRIAQRGAPFVSRGDESGTHHKERDLWHHAGLEPAGDWYLSAGSSMAQTLRMATEKRAYTLSDRGTFLAQRAGLELVVVCEGDPMLHNPYAAMVVNPRKHPHVQAGAAQQLVDYLVSPPAQALIARYGVESFGEPLFFLQVPARE